MQRVARLMVAMVIGMVMVLSVATSVAAPAAPSYVGVEGTIGAIRQAWSRAGARVEPNAPGLNALFDALLESLRSYAKAETDQDRLVALNRVYQISVALGTVSWAPAANLREELREWLR